MWKNRINVKKFYCESCDVINWRLCYIFDSPKYAYKIMFKFSVHSSNNWTARGKAWKRVYYFLCRIYCPSQAHAKNSCSVQKVASMMDFYIVIQRLLLVIAKFISTGALNCLEIKLTEPYCEDTRRICIIYDGSVTLLRRSGSNLITPPPRGFNHGPAGENVFQRKTFVIRVSRSTIFP